MTHLNRKIFKHKQRKSLQFLMYQDLVQSFQLYLAFENFNNASNTQTAQIHKFKRIPKLQLNCSTGSGCNIKIKWTEKDFKLLEIYFLICTFLHSSGFSTGVQSKRTRGSNLMITWTNIQTGSRLYHAVTDQEDGTEK